MSIQVKVRNVLESESVPFATISEHTKLPALIEFISQSGGINDESFHSYRLCSEGGIAFIEILIGDDE